MNSVAVLSPDERADLFKETAARRGLLAGLVEKDFWVSWVLMQLFTMPGLQGNIVFKGGTSLSKVFNVIHRFSEDVDLIINFEMLGFAGEREPGAQRSRTQRDALIKEMVKACSNFVEGALVRDLGVRFASILGEGGWELRTRRSRDGGAQVEFVYPPAVTERVDYLTPYVLLEPGTNAEMMPRDTYLVRSFAAEEFPGLFRTPAVTLEAITAERSFWEKATILHVEYHRPPEKKIPSRYSRHYYDLAMLAGTKVRAKAVGDSPLRDRVVKHKTDFYFSQWARYELAVPPTLRLVPPAARLEELRHDYKSMSVMIFGTPPPFDELIETLKVLEAEINGAAL